MAYFGDRPDLEADSMAAHLSRGGVTQHPGERGSYSLHSSLPHPISFLRPMTPYGETYTPSYTRYLNAPGSSYVHPMFPVFNDRRPAQKKIRTSLYTEPGNNPGMG